MSHMQQGLSSAVLEHIYDSAVGAEPASMSGLRERFGEDDTARTCHSLRSVA